MGFEMVHKPTFVNQLLVIPPDRIKQVIKKTEVLRDNPYPDGDSKKKLQGYRGNIYRLRSGDYRILYTFDNSCVTLLTVDARKDVYRGKLPAAEGVSLASIEYEHVDDDLLEVGSSARAPYGGETYGLKTQESGDELPVLITKDFLSRLQVPIEYAPALCTCRTIDDLIAAKVPPAIRERVFDVVASRELDQVLQQPSFITGDAGDLLRFVQGELIGFMLKLSPEQEQLAYWVLNRTGPTLVKGGPGTGKSTIAMYRVKGVINQYRAKGEVAPKILFTTYTRTLVAFSKQLLEGLLGQDADCVTVKTADSIARDIVTKVDGEPRIAHETVQQRRLHEAIAKVKGVYAHGALQRRVSFPTSEVLSIEYLLDEFGQVIEAQELRKVDQYLTAPRVGRKVRLGVAQRRFVWEVYEEFCSRLHRDHSMTWHQLRRRAVEITRKQHVHDEYDAVIVDEVQDLDPTMLHLLVSLCKNPNRLFLTADANQSIYGGMFRWSAVHEKLQFRGRTAVLRTNYRSTREIGEAAHAFLSGGVLDDPIDDRTYATSGPKPKAHIVPDVKHETRLLRQFLLDSARDQRLGLEGCAVLVPSWASGKAVATRLREVGIPATFMSGQDIDLKQPVVKVLPIKSSKGLEFPVVALAGFLDGCLSDATDAVEAGERDEMLDRDQRTIFVAMTRAMRALMVILPPMESPSLRLRGFSQAYWSRSDDRTYGRQ